jgi:hypothetical protein
MQMLHILTIYNCFNRSQIRVSTCGLYRLAPIAKIEMKEAFYQHPSSAKEFNPLAGIFFHVLRFQGAYYLLSGLWPLLSIETFQAITGPKTDLWLVKTVGLLLMVNGLILSLGGYLRQINWPISVLSIGTALAIAGIELVYVIHGTISAIYLLDAALEIPFIIAWLRRKP